MEWKKTLKSKFFCSRRKFKNKKGKGMEISNNVKMVKDRKSNIFFQGGEAGVSTS